MERSFLKLIFCMIICNYMSAQIKSKKDSIFLKLKTEKYDTVKLGLLDNLRVIYYNEGKLDSELFYIIKAIDLSRKIKSEYCLACSLNDKGYHFEKIGNRDSALVIFRHNSELPRNLRNYREILSAYHHIGNYYYDKGDFNLSLKNNYCKQMHITKK